MYKLRNVFRFASIFEKCAARQERMMGANWWQEPLPAQPKGAALPSSFWVKFVQMCQRLEVSPYDLAAVINKESAFDPAARNFASGKNNPPVAQGFNQLIRATAKGLGINDELWKKFAHMSAEEQLKWVEKYFRRARVKGKSAGQLYLMNFGGFNNPDGSLYAGHDAQQRWIAQHPEDKDKFKRSAYQQKAIEQNPGLVTNGRIMASSITRLVSGGIKGDIKGKIDEAARAVGNNPPPPFEEPSGEWQGPSITPQLPSGPVPTPVPAGGPQTPEPLKNEYDQLVRTFFS